jgi:hypothetical protein
LRCTKGRSRRPAVAAGRGVRPYCIGLPPACVRKYTPCPGGCAVQTHPGSSPPVRHPCPPWGASVLHRVAARLRPEVHTPPRRLCSTDAPRVISSSPPPPPARGCVQIAQLRRPAASRMQHSAATPLQYRRTQGHPLQSATPARQGVRPDRTTLTPGCVQDATLSRHPSAVQTHPGSSPPVRQPCPPGGASRSHNSAARLRPGCSTQPLPLCSTDAPGVCPPNPALSLAPKRPSQAAPPPPNPPPARFYIPFTEAYQEVPSQLRSPPRLRGCPHDLNQAERGDPVAHLLVRPGRPSPCWSGRDAVLQPWHG